MEYLNELNEPQRKAVEQTEGPVMIIAGAGSGKTRVLMYRTAHLINTGVDPFNILALTFTNKAAREMRHRISTIVSPSEAKNVWMGTFHSIFSKILRIESDKITYPSNFTIFDTTDSRSLIKRLVKDNGLDPKIYKASIIHNRISNAKNNLISPDEYENDEQIIIDDEASGRPKTAELYRMYNERLFKSGAMDFDDLLFNMNILLKEFGDVLYKYQQKFKYILVDEYQDTNYAQYMIIKQLAAQHENICVVGDDAQSIYSFRGANIQNILNFKSDYSDCNVFKLEQNYRSTQFLVNAANSLIEKNNDQIQKTIWTSNDKGYKIEVKKTATDNEEGKWIADKVFEQQNEHKAEPKDFAILYRTNAQSRSIEEALRKQNIPYRIYGGLSFYQRKEIKDLMGYFRLTVNHDDEEALKRIINFPKRGIGNTTIEKAIVAADKHSKSIWEILTSPDAFQLKINKGTIEKLREFITMIKSFRTLHDSYDAYQLAHHIASSSGILKTLSTDKTPEGVNRYENVQELLNGIKEFCEQKKKEDPE
ncbi:MAG: ATP-dependent helicase, partial [Flavobacteriales bacterium]